MKEFLRCLKDMKNNIYLNRFRKSIEREHVKKVIFYDGLDVSFLNSRVGLLEKQGIAIDGICLPDKAFDKLTVQFAGDLIKLSALPHYGKPVTIFIINYSPWMGQFIELFNKWGISDSFILDGINHQAVYDVLFDHVEELYEVYDMLDAGDSSRQTYLSVLRAKVSGNVADLLFEECPQYFVDGYGPQAGDTIIDGGAYDGNTAYHFMSSIHGEGKIFAFEMDADNYKTLLANINRNPYSADIVAENLGLGGKETQIPYIKGGTASHVASNGNAMANIIDLDTYVYRNKINRVDLIKLDVEGSELESLMGARQAIVKWKPRLQVCLYHNLNDLWTIPLYIKKLKPNYKFSLRHHHVDGGSGYVNLDEWQTFLHRKYRFSTNYKTFWETVLYCK